MRHWVRKLAILFVAFCISVGVMAQDSRHFPQSDGERARYNVQIDFRKAYISGICMMLNEGGTVNCYVFNEFGVPAMTYTYNIATGKVKIISIIGKMNRWYIKKMIRRDLAQLMSVLHKDEGGEYTNSRVGVKYSFTILNDTDNGTSE
ncbi:MAG: hypothetical protein IKX93_00660 [Bacteroidaceae bacterium]|nr:hypothetical protein [Bacteroidaceae bacterium]